MSAAKALRHSVERCDGFIDALYLLAVLHRGDLRLAEEAVIDAIASAVIDPLINASDARHTWQLLATHFHAANEQSVLHGSPQALVREAELSIAQRETMALIASGRGADEVAALLGVPTAQVHDEFRRGTQALQAAMTSRPPKPSPEITPHDPDSRRDPKNLDKTVLKVLTGTRRAVSTRIRTAPEIGDNAPRASLALCISTDERGWMRRGCE